MMIGRKSLTSSIDFCCAINANDPAKDVFNHPLIQLMQKIGCDGAVDVNVWQLFPEGVDNGFNAFILTGLGKFFRIRSNRFKRMQDSCKVSKPQLGRCITKLIALRLALGTPKKFYTGYK